jgi:hypothetical protein
MLFSLFNYRQGGGKFYSFLARPVQTAQVTTERYKLEDKYTDLFYFVFLWK